MGNVTKEIDYEKGYTICWAEAIAIVKKIAKKKIKKYGIQKFYAVHNNLNNTPKPKPLWYIGFMDGNETYQEYYNKKGSIRYVIDGVTGKLLRTYYIKKVPE